MKRESKQRKQGRRSHVKSHNWKGRYQKMQLQLRGETGKKKQGIARSVIKENVQTYRSGWEQMIAWLQNSS